MKKGVLLVAMVAVIISSCGKKHPDGGQSQPEVVTGMAVQADQTFSSAISTPAAIKRDTSAVHIMVKDTLSTDTSQVIGGGTIQLTKADFLKNVWNYENSPHKWIFLGDKPAIIDFYGDWCAPCKIASPILEEISNEYAGRIVVYKIDTQRERELAALFGVRSIPSFLYIPQAGRPTITAGIARTEEDTRKMFVENISRLLHVK